MGNGKFVKRFDGVLKTVTGAPKGIRIPVAGLKGRCPRPLDDGGVPLNYSRDRSGMLL